MTFSSSALTRSSWFRVLLLILAALAAWGVALRDDFAWDDTYLVRDNPAIRSLESIPGFFLRPWASGTDYDLGARQNATYYRPLALASMALDHALFGGAPWGHHLTNVLTHLACALVLFRLFSHWQALRGSPSWVPWMAALWWVVHPVHSEAVHLISYRTTLLSTLMVFGILCLLTPRGPDRSFSPGRLVAAMGLWVLGLLAKETSAVALPLLVLQDLFFRTLDRRRILAVYLPMGILAALWWTFRSQVTAPGIYSWFEGLTPWQSALMVPRVFFLYLRLVLFPWPLCPFYDWSVLGVPRSPLEPDILAGLLLAFLVLGAAVLTRRRAPEVSLAVQWFLLALLPVSHLMPFFDAAGERFLHLPIAGALFALVSAGARVDRPTLRRGLTGLFLVGVLGGTTLSFLRGLDWRDSETVLQASVRDFPQSVSAWLGLGRLHLEDGRFPQAAQAFRRAQGLAPSLPVVHGLLAAAQALSGDTDGARHTLLLAPPPPSGLPSAAEVARQEIVRAGRPDILGRSGL